MKIAITLTSSLSVGQEYIDLTKSIAQVLAQAQFGVVYGGTEYGMMEELAKSYKRAGGTDLTGVMSKELESVTKNYKAFSDLDESIWVNQIGERIRKMIDLADGFVIFPGGYGGLEEAVSIISGKANKLHVKPIVLYNHGGFYNQLIQFFDFMHKKQFSKISLPELVYVCDDINEIVTYFKKYSTTDLPDKFI